MLSLEDTKYCRWYFNIVNYRKDTIPSGYVEKHHIIPRSLGGIDDADNIVKLTAREHFVCHLLLTKMFSRDKYKTAKMVRAWCGMSWRRNEFRTYKVNSRIFEAYRKKFSVLVSESQTENNSQQNTMWIYNVQLKENKKISRDEEIPDGWSQGRVVDWDKFEDNLSLKQCACCVKYLTATSYSWKYCSVGCRKQALSFRYKLKRETTPKPERVAKAVELRQCKSCGITHSRIKSDFCSSNCYNKYTFHTLPETLTTICKDGIIKQIKPQNYPAYKKYGWVKVIENGTP